MPHDLESLYHEYSRKVYLYLFSLCQDAALSEDLMQETFLKAAKSIDQFRHDSSLSSWLCAIAKNLFRDACRKQKPTVNIDDISLASEDVRRDIRIFSCLHQLDDPFREIVYLRTFGQLSYQEISEIMHKSESWCRVMYHRGKKKLRDLWLEQLRKEEPPDKEPDPIKEKEESS